MYFKPALYVPVFLLKENIYYKTGIYKNITRFFTPMAMAYANSPNSLPD